MSAKDATKDYGLRDDIGEPIWQTGVWLSDVPLDPNDGAHGSTLLEVTVEAGDGVLDDFEWIEEGKPYREWLIRADVLNPLMIGIQITSEILPIRPHSRFARDPSPR